MARQPIPVHNDLSSTPSPSQSRKPRGKAAKATPLILLFVLFHQAYVAVGAQYLPAAHRGTTRFGRSSLKIDDAEFSGGSVLKVKGGNVSVGERSVIPRNTSNAMIPRDDQSSTSTAMYLVSHDDFCLFGPPDPFQYISDTALDVVSWCSQSAHNTRLIPDGTLHGVTYVKANNWVQVSGTGDFTKINIAPGDSGGQFDSTTNTPSGAQMYVSDDSDTATSWVTMISADTFCVRACTGDAKYCPTNYDEMGCWFFTSNGVGWDDVWQDCQGDDGDLPGVVDGTTYTQGATPVPTFTAPAVSNCQGGSSVSNGQSAPASQTWTGDSASATGSNVGSESASDGGSASGDGGSTSWVAVQTCVPCTTTAGSGASSSGSDASSASSVAASSSGSGSSGGTEQVGVTQLGGTSTAVSGASAAGSIGASASATGASENGGVAAIQLSGTGSASTITKAATSASTSAPTSKTTSTSESGSENGGSDELLDRRGWLMRDDSDGGTTTSNGQCCFTTWTASVVGGGATATSGGSAATGSTIASGSGGGSKSGSTTGSAAKSGSTSGSRSATATGAAGASSTLKTGNTTASSNSSSNSSRNGRNSSSSAFGLLDFVPLGSGNGVGSLVGLVLGTVGWMLVGSGMLM